MNFNNIKQREIKFRAWYGNKMHDNTEALRIMYNKANSSTITTDAEIMQFTGLTDKNGKEIYEGDILKGSYTNPLLVVYDNGAFCFENNPQGGSDRVHQIRTERLRIIGNIYENPELL